MMTQRQEEVVPSGWGFIGRGLFKKFRVVLSVMKKFRSWIVVGTDSNLAGMSQGSLEFTLTMDIKVCFVVYLFYFTLGFGFRDRL